MSRLLVLTVAVVTLAASAGCGGGRHAAAAPSGAGSPRVLHSIGELRTAFNAHQGEPRLIVLVSPT
jgi:hypothetical protein